MAPSRHHQKVIKILKELRGYTAFTNYAYLLGVANSTLCRVLVQRAKDVVQAGAEVHAMKAIPFVCLKS